MSAAAFILLVMFLLLMLMAIYYSWLCYPIIFKTDKKYGLKDPERNQLIPVHSDHNDNNQSAPASGVSVPVAGMPDDRTLPVRHSPHAVVASKQSLDVPDSAEARPAPDAGGVDTVCDEKLQRRSDPSSDVLERRTLLHGDDEDGLYQCQPSVRSKNTAEPIPPPNNSAEPHTVIVVPPTPNIPLNLAVSPMTSAAAPTPPVEHSPSHVIVNIPQPLNVPPEQNMSVSHPPSHVVVSGVPQPLNAPPLMVAPVYDEPPMDVHPVAVNLHQHLNPISSMPVAVTPSSAVVPGQYDSFQENKSLPDNTYGWKDSVTSLDVDETINAKNAADDKGPVKEVDGSEISTEVEQIVEELCDTASQCVRSTPTLKQVDNATSVEIAPSDKDDRSDTPCDQSSEVSPRSKGDSNGSDTSDAEITEYTFETSRQVTSINSVLGGEICSVSNVRIIKYTAINDSVILEAHPSPSDSIKVHVDRDHNDTSLSEVAQIDNESDSEEQFDGGQSRPDKSVCASPDLTIPRRSPDGDSMKSVDEENCKKTPPTSAAGSPKKTPAAQNAVVQIPESEIL